MTQFVPFLILLFLLPALFLLALLWGQSKLEREPVSLLAKTFLCGMVAVIPFIALRWLAALCPSISLQSVLQRSFLGQEATFLIFLLILAAAEEALKHLAMLKGLESSHHLIDRRLDGVLYGASAAIGFSLIDNASFLVADIFSFDWSSFVLFASRAIGFTLMHITATGIFGLLYATAILRRGVTPHSTAPLYHFHRHFPQAFRLHIIRAHLAAGSDSKHGHERGELVAEGLVLAIILHAIYLWLVKLAIFGELMTLLLVPLLVFMLLGVLDVARRLDRKGHTFSCALMSAFKRLVAGRHARMRLDKK